MVKKKINDELFKILYDEGLSRNEIATYFDVTTHRISVKKIELNFGEREIHCQDCGQLFKTDYFGRFRCNVCQLIKQEQFRLQRYFYRLLEREPDRAKQFEYDMINEEGFNFRELALNGLSTYDELKPIFISVHRKKDIVIIATPETDKKEPCNSKGGFNFLVPMTMASIFRC